MFVSPAQAPYAGVYQRQPTGLPQAEFTPQMAYQSNGLGGQMYVPQMNGQMPPSYEQSQNEFQPKKNE